MINEEDRYTFGLKIAVGVGFLVGGGIMAVRGLVNLVTEPISETQKRIKNMAYELNEKWHGRYPVKEVNVVFTDEPKKNYSENEYQIKSYGGVEGDDNIFLNKSKEVSYKEK